MTDPTDTPAENSANTQTDENSSVHSQVQEAITNLNVAGSNGAKWFYWIAGLSLVNTIILHTGGQIQFIVGLAITLIVDVLASEIGKQEPQLATGLMAISIAFSIFVSLVACLFGWLSQRRILWIFGIGMFVYLLDGLLFLLVGDFFSAAFHGYALFSMFQGFNAYRQLNRLELAMESSASGSAQDQPEIGIEQV